MKTILYIFKAELVLNRIGHLFIKYILQLMQNVCPGICIFWNLSQTLGFLL